ncbi:MAG: HAD family phosphatase [Anaerolineae bacterium]|nr:HAD family phosphatase [Anaerolineae bacterium]
MRRSRGLALDMDGTLMDSMGFHAQAWVFAFRDAGLRVEIEWFYLLEGVSGPEVIERTFQRAGSARPDAQTVDAIRLAKNAHFDQLFTPKPMVGVYDLFAVIERLNYPVAVVTGSENAVASRMLETVSLRQFVRALVGSDDVVYGKPAPDPYAKAAQLLGVPPDHALALENAPAGIESAKAAGLPCVAVETTLPREHLLRADHHVPDLIDFAAFLEREADVSGGAGAWRVEKPVNH